MGTNPTCQRGRRTSGISSRQANSARQNARIDPALFERPLRRTAALWRRSRWCSIARPPPGPAAGPASARTPSVRAGGRERTWVSSRLAVTKGLPHTTDAPRSATTSAARDSFSGRPLSEIAGQGILVSSSNTVLTLRGVTCDGSSQGIRLHCHWRRTQRPGRPPRIWRGQASRSACWNGGMCWVGAPRANRCGPATACRRRPTSSVCCCRRSFVICGSSTTGCRSCPATLPRSHRCSTAVRC